VREPDLIERFVRDIRRMLELSSSRISPEIIRGELERRGLSDTCRAVISD